MKLVVCTCILFTSELKRKSARKLKRLLNRRPGSDGTLDKGPFQKEWEGGTREGRPPLRIATHLSLIGETSQETLPLTPVQDLQLFVVDAVLLSYVLPRVQRRPLLVHAKLPTASTAAGLWERIQVL